MADGPTGPDFGALLSLIKSSEGQGGSGCAPILMGLRLDQNVGAGLTIQGRGFGEKMVNQLPQGKLGLFASLFKQMGLTREEVCGGLQKINSAGALQPMPFQQASIADINGPGPLPGGGGSFASMVGGPSGGSGGGIDFV